MAIDDVYNRNSLRRLKPPLGRRRGGQALPIDARHQPPPLLGAHPPARLVQLRLDELVTVHPPQAQPDARAVPAHQLKARAAAVGEDVDPARMSIAPVASQIASADSCITVLASTRPTGLPASRPAGSTSSRPRCAGTSRTTRALRAAPAPAPVAMLALHSTWPGAAPITRSDALVNLVRSRRHAGTGHWPATATRDRATSSPARYSSPFQARCNTD